jgi:hypothetical protein
MIIVGNTFVDEAVTSSAFCCDLKACKGACCCLEGGRGAPLTDEEVPLIATAFPFAKEYLDIRSLDVIDREGLVEGYAGSFATPCIDHRECVFVYFDGGIAKCAFERAYNEGKTNWRKPISCHLFPIRLRHLGLTFLRYEQMPECLPAREYGAAANITLVDFLKDPLIRAFGEPWYMQLRDQQIEMT